VYIIYLSTLLTLNSCTTILILNTHQEKLNPIKEIPDSAFLSIIEPYKIGIDSIMNEVLCYSRSEMFKKKPESELGNFVTDLCLERFSDKADICVMNYGGLRSALPKGKITIGDIYTLMPFENELVIVELDASENIELIEYIVSRGGEPFSGIEIIINKQGEIQYQKKGFGSFDENKIRVLTSDYLANGGDDMKFFKDKKQKKVGLKVRDAILEHCLVKDTISPYLDERIKYEK